MAAETRNFNDEYAGPFINRIAMPMGGIGAGMVCLEGTGAISHVSVRNNPEVFNEPMTFSAISIDGNPDLARVIEGPVPDWKKFGQAGSGNGASGKSFGLPRFSSATFTSRFPFGIVKLKDEAIPVEVEITGWSPFIPGDSHSSSLPFAAMEFTFRNTSDKQISAVYSYNASNFMGKTKEKASVKAKDNGFILFDPGSDEKPWDYGAFVAQIIGEDNVAVNAQWFRGGWWDPLTITWKNVLEGKTPSAGEYEDGKASLGGSLYVPFKLEAGAEKTVKLLFSWDTRVTQERHGRDPEPENKCESDDPECCKPTPQEQAEKAHKPYYSAHFADYTALADYWAGNYQNLREQTDLFAETFYSSTVPSEIIEAVAANISILKSPTVLRQTDGRIWAWEGCWDSTGCCSGSCTHVWNYAQAMPHLFPDLERTLRMTEFNQSQDEKGHQVFRSALPIRPLIHDFHAASDGQLGGIMKVYREWKVSGDTEWLKSIWQQVKASLGYCIEAWDPRHKGILEEPHHNTYDIEFWGPNGMCTSFYLGALSAGIEMGKELQDEVPIWQDLLDKGISYMESELWDGEYFYQKVQWEGLNTKPPLEDPNYSPEAVALLKEEGPKYQYGKGCASDGILGAWMAEVCQVPTFLSEDKVTSNLKAIHKYNLRHDLSTHSNPQRPSYALGNEGGLLLCTWPKGGQLTLPFVYSNEVWTGIEYQVASHLLLHGCVEEGLEIVRECRKRYDGRVRNPFNEYECGHWYARAMSSYGLLQGISGVTYDAVHKKLRVAPSMKGDFQCFFAASSGYGFAGVRNGEAFIDIKSGQIDITDIEYIPAA